MAALLARSQRLWQPHLMRRCSLAPSRQLAVVGGVIAAALIAGGCGTDHRTSNATAAKVTTTRTQMLPNTAPDAGAPSISAALSRYKAAAGRLDAVEICRLSYYVDAACVPRVSLAFKRLKENSSRVTTQIISTSGTGNRTIVVLQSTYHIGRNRTTQRGRLGFGSRHGRWFIDPAD
jgi:hypothetical protein